MGVPFIHEVAVVRYPHDHDVPVGIFNSQLVAHLLRELLLEPLLVRPEVFKGGLDEPDHHSCDGGSDGDEDDGFGHCDGDIVLVMFDV